MKNILIFISTLLLFLPGVVLFSSCKKDVDAYDAVYVINYELDKGTNNSLNPEMFSSKETIHFEEPTKYGYKFIGWYSSLDENAEKVEVVKNSKKDITLFAKWEFDESFFDELPVVSISTNDVPILSKTDYVNASFELFNTSAGEFDVCVSMKNFLDEKESVGIRLRGNSTMAYSKKPYRIKFEKKISLFGLEKNKNWVLLADYLDPTSLRNFSAFTLADQFENLDFVNHPNHVVLYLNGEYKGLYLLTEQIDEKFGRVDVETDFVSGLDTDFPFLVEMDRAALNEGVTGIDNFSLGEISSLVYPIEIKYPESDERGENSDFVYNYIYNYMYAVFDSLINGSTFYKETEVHFEDLVDIDSFIDFYLVNEIMSNYDSTWGSVYMHKTKTGKLEFGPVWDFDFSASYWNENVMYTENETAFTQVIFSNSIFKYFLQDENNFLLVKNRYNEKKHCVLDLAFNLKNYQNIIYNVAVKDAVFWYGDGQNVIDTEFKNYRMFLFDRYYYLNNLLNNDYEVFISIINE